MANAFTGRVWKLDTAGATSAVNAPVFLDKMTWLPAAAGNSLKVVDRDSNIIWETAALTGTVAGDQVWDNPNPKMPFSGFYLTTMSAGTLYVTVG
jgi:hypothetical protein